MSRNLADLKRECEQLGLTVVQSGKREAKSDYETALREYHWHDIPAQDRPEQIEPMLARNVKDVSSEDATAMWTDNNNWVAQPKINGCRAMFNIRNPAAGRINWMTSRRLSDETYRLNELHDQMVHYRDLNLGAEWEGTVVDGEVLAPVAEVDTSIVDGKGVTTGDILQSTAAMMNCSSEKSIKLQERYGKLVLHAFDCLRFQGQDIRHLPYRERYEFLKKVVARVQEVMGDLPCQHCQGVTKAEKAPLPQAPEAAVDQDDFLSLLNT